MKALAVALLLGAATLAVAADPSAPLTLDDCIATSSSRNPALTAAQAGVDSADAAVQEARAPYYPQVDLSAGYHRWQRRAFLPSGLAVPGGRLPELIGPLDDWNGGLQSRITLYDFGERKAATAAAQARRSGADADLAATRADVRLAVQTAYFGLGAAQELRAVATRNLARAEGHERLATALREAGAAPLADLLRAQAEVADARLQLIGAESRVRVAAGRLNSAMGRPAETPIQIATGEAPMPPPDEADLRMAAERALAQRPEMAAGERRVEAAQAAVRAARASRAPKLRADGSFGRRDTAWVPDTREWQAGLSVDLPIFDGRSRASRIARSRAEAVREQAGFESRRLQVREQVWAAAAELERAWAAIAASSASVRAHEESLRVVQERYQHGAALITDLLDTQSALARGEAALAESRWSYQQARASFDRAVGR